MTSAPKDRARLLHLGVEGEAEEDNDLDIEVPRPRSRPRWQVVAAALAAALAVAVVGAVASPLVKKKKRSTLIFMSAAQVVAESPLAVLPAAPAASVPAAVPTPVAPEVPVAPAAPAALVPPVDSPTVGEVLSPVAPTVQAMPPLPPTSGAIPEVPTIAPLVPATPTVAAPEVPAVAPPALPGTPSVAAPEVPAVAPPALPATPTGAAPEVPAVAPPALPAASVPGAVLPTAETEDASPPSHEGITEESQGGAAAAEDGDDDADDRGATAAESAENDADGDHTRGAEVRDDKNEENSEKGEESEVAAVKEAKEKPGEDEDSEEEGEEGDEASAKEAKEAKEKLKENEANEENDEKGDVADANEAIEKPKENEENEGIEDKKETNEVKQESDKETKKEKTEKTEKKEKKEKKEVCKMAVKDDDCYKSVVWAMTDGIKKHPEWYDGLTKKSLFEDFQSNLALSPKDTKCFHKPCKTSSNCKTASPDSACYSGVKWDMTEGIKKHPDWYAGLSESSSFEEFQRHAHQNNKTQCPTEPCNEQPFKDQTLFCWMAVQLEGYELGLVTAQKEKDVGIFACDDYALVSTKDLGVGGVTTLIISNMEVGGYTDGGTSPNAPIFVEAWNQVQSDGRWKEHDWTVKSDPDAVLIPDRLKQQLLPGQQPENPYPPPYKSDPSKGQWVTNCDKMAGWGKGWGDGWPMMYGSIEIISRDALELYYANYQSSCQGPGGIGEDAYMGLCLRALEVGELFIKQGDNVCAGGACDDQSFSSYHPYKDPGSWFDCHGQATR